MGPSLGARARTSFSLGVDMAARALFVRKAAGLPVPPVKKIYAVIGAGPTGSAAFRYAIIGQQTYEMINAVLLCNDVAVEGDVLDFGCGSGRVIRWFRSHQSGAVAGSDYNPHLIEWCRTHLTGFEFAVNEVEPPLAQPDDRFALVYAMSVFTHLDEPLQSAWLRELGRVTAPGGHLVVTTHGRRFWAVLTPEERRRFTDGEIVVQKAQSRIGSNVYSTFQSGDHFRGLVESAGLKVVDYVPWGAYGGRGQDLWLLRRP
jgi:SAM-dependent methyltransferase